MTRKTFTGLLLREFEVQLEHRGTIKPDGKWDFLSRANRRLLVAWMQAEGSKAAYNPLATTKVMPGASNFNSVGVKNYLSPHQGAEATIATLLESGHKYEPIVAGLMNNKAPIETAEKVILSDWGTGGAGQLLIDVLEGYRGHPERYERDAAIEVAG